MKCESSPACGSQMAVGGGACVEESSPARGGWPTAARALGEGATTK